MRFKTYTGQDHIKTLLSAEVDAALRWNKPLRHVILTGGPGLGKSRLARSLANELNYDFKVFTADASLTSKAVAELLIRLPSEGYTKAGEYREGKFTLIFIDEIHKLKNFEAWYEPLQEFHVSWQGSRGWVPYFTLVSATTALERLPKPFVDRCPLQYSFRPYDVSDLAAVIQERFPGYDADLAVNVARRSRGTVRIALGFAESVLNFGGPEFFDVNGIDEAGLTTLDREYINVLTGLHKPMAVATIAARLQQEVRTVEEIIEPYLIRLGIVEKVAGGRQLCHRGRPERAGDDAFAAFYAAAGVVDVGRRIRVS